MDKEVYDKAFDVAEKSLRACYDKQGIMAGRRHFDDYWARDSFFSIWGALELEDYDVVKDNLELFIKHQKMNGQLPMRIGTTHIGQTLKFVGVRIDKTVPIYYQDKLFSYPQDQNSLFIIAFKKYVEKTKDYAYLKHNFELLQNILGWYEYQKKKGLIYGKKYATWQDSIKKKGYTLYNNVLYYQALTCMDFLAHKLDYKKDYARRAKDFKDKLNDFFWKEHHYVDWVDDEHIRHDYFSTDGNTLAVLFGIADKQKAKKISQYILKNDLLKPFGARTNHPKYDPKQVFFWFKPLGLSDYQNNGALWVWLGVLCIFTLHIAGYKKEALHELQKISEVLAKHDLVYEVYSQNSRPLKRFFYKSEAPFAWSSAFFILAYKTLIRK
ncbi:hypothetical protein GOV05_04160 [Candidatus Woesearchaeota archaeon]|nr:hypothetical protein [Candidatus Woesearchaeota archaeon]